MSDSVGVRVPLQHGVGLEGRADGVPSQEVDPLAGPVGEYGLLSHE